MSKEIDIKVSKILSMTNFATILKLIICGILVSWLSFVITYPIEYTIFNFISCVLVCITMIAIIILCYFGIQISLEKYIKNVLLTNDEIKDNEI